MDQTSYGQQVRDVALFLRGRHRELTTGLTRRMETAAETLEFETAARLRDQLRAIETTLQPDGGAEIQALLTYDPKGKMTSRKMVDAKGKPLREERPMAGGKRWAMALGDAPKPMPAGRGSLTSEKPEMSEDAKKEMVMVAYNLFEKKQYIEALPLYQMSAANFPEDPGLN